MTRWVARGLGWAAVAWCLAIGVWLWMTPTRSEGIATTAYADSSGVVQQTAYRFTNSQSFADHSLLGPVPLIVPVLLAAVGAWAVWRRRMVSAAIATVLLLVFTVLAGFSIGAGYVPAVGALAWALIALADE